MIIKNLIQKLTLFALKIFSSFSGIIKISRIQELPLKRHIKDLINQGYSKNNIAERLINVGFNKENIENVFLELENKAEEEHMRREETRIITGGDAAPITVVGPEKTAGKNEKGEMGWVDLFYLASRSFRNRASRTLLTVAPT